MHMRIITILSLIAGIILHTPLLEAKPTIRGSGTPNFIPKFTASDQIGNSMIFEDGTNVVIESVSIMGRIILGSQTVGLTDDAGPVTLTVSTPVTMINCDALFSCDINGFADAEGAPVVGQVILIMNVTDPLDAVSVKILAGPTIHVHQGNPQIVLGPNDSVQFMYDGARWTEVAGSY